MSRIIRQDREFLGRLDWAWAALFTLASVLISPVLQEVFFGNFSFRLLAIFIILLVGVILPFVVEIWAYVSTSARGRFLSWVMLISALIVMLVDYVFDAVVLKPVGPMVSGIVSGLIMFGSVMYCATRIAHYFQANLKSSLYQAQIPTIGPARGLGRDVRSILYFYIGVGMVVGILFGM